MPFADAGLSFVVRIFVRQSFASALYHRPQDRSGATGNMPGTSAEADLTPGRCLGGLLILAAMFAGFVVFVNVILPLLVG